MKAKEKKVPTVFQASIPILSMLIILGVGIGGFGLPADVGRYDPDADLLWLETDQSAIFGFDSLCRVGNRFGDDRDLVGFSRYYRGGFYGRCDRYGR